MTATYSTRRLSAMLLPAALFLGACVAPRPMTTPQDCPRQCRIDISLPANKGEAPSIPASQMTTRGRKGMHVTFQVPGVGNRPRVLLVFAEPALEGSGNKALWTVKLTPGANVLRLLDTNKCTAPGCKYTIVYLDDQTSPPLDPWMIIDP